MIGYATVHNNYLRDISFAYAIFIFEITTVEYNKTEGLLSLSLSCIHIIPIFLQLSSDIENAFIDLRKLSP